MLDHLACLHVQYTEEALHGIYFIVGLVDASLLHVPTDEFIGNTRQTIVVHVLYFTFARMDVVPLVVRLRENHGIHDSHTSETTQGASENHSLASRVDAELVYL